MNMRSGRQNPMKMKTFAALLLFIGLTVASADVVSLDKSNFDDHVDGSKYSLVEFYAPWCGHCKNLAPEYEVVGKHYRAGDEVLIAKVDADSERDLASTYDVKGYPTLKWFPKGSTDPEDYNGPRDAAGIVQWINQRTGLKREIKPEPSDVVTLTPANFDKIVMDPSKDVFIKFYAPWCGHCKKMAPAWAKLGGAFAGEKDVVVAKVDANEHKELASRFGISGYPSLKFFSKGSTDKEAENYKGGRDLPALLSFLNDKAGTYRTEDGGLTAEAGRIKQLDDLLGGPLSSDVVTKAEEIVLSLTDAAAEHGQIYLKVMKKIIEKGSDYIGTETARVEKLLQSESVSPAKKTLFSLKKNILAAFGVEEEQ